MKIFKATIDDCSQMAALFNKAHKPFELIWNDEEKEVFGSSTIKTKEDCIFMMEGRETYCVKNDDDSVVAYISFRKKNDYVVWISELYVNPDFQNMGVGKLLIDFTTEFAQKENCKLIALETHALADWAIGFYIKLGFEIVNERIEESPYDHILDKPQVEGRPILAKVI